MPLEADYPAQGPGETGTRPAHRPTALKGPALCQGAYGKSACGRQDRSLRM